MGRWIDAEGDETEGASRRLIFAPPLHRYAVPLPMEWEGMTAQPSYGFTNSPSMCSFTSSPRAGRAKLMPNSERLMTASPSKPAL